MVPFSAVSTSPTRRTPEIAGLPVAFRVLELVTSRAVKLAASLPLLSWTGLEEGLV